MNEKYTYKQFQAEYPNDDKCLDSILYGRYGNNNACPNCGVIGKLTRIKTRRAYACHEGCHIYPCSGTIFDKSRTPLTDWFYAMYLMTSTRNGMSAMELQRQLGVTYKCAWRMGHRIRELMGSSDQTVNSKVMTGHIEIDETYIGGKIKVKRRGKGEYLKNKSTVFGMVERDGILRGMVVPNEKRQTLLPIIKQNVAMDAIISTDTLHAYKILHLMGYQHGKVNHMVDQWANGIYSTNSIEGFWSHLKRGIKSTHASVSKKHLQKYVDEFVFRYNHRKQPATMFHSMLAQVGKCEK